jgi:hypothetical protein
VLVFPQVFVKKRPFIFGKALDVAHSAARPQVRSLRHQAAAAMAIFSLSSMLVGGYPALSAEQDYEDAKPPAQTSTANQDWDYDTDATKDVKKSSAIMLRGGVNYLVPKGTPFKLKLATVPTHGQELKLLDRDLDGNLLPAKVGDLITAKTSEDFYVDDNKVIPEGTVFHGHVSSVVPPRRVNRPGWLQIEFDGLTTPDGRKFAFAAQADNFKKSTFKSKLKSFGEVASYTAGGGITGALVAYQLFGLHNTIAMHGYNIAGGAGAGALMATCYAVMRHGARATLEPGDDLNMSIDCDLLMPAASEPLKKTAYNRKGVNVQILKSKVVNDGLEGKILRVEVNIANDTDEPLSSIDLFAEDTNGTRMPLVGGADVDESSSFLFTIEPHSKRRTVLNFLVEFPKMKRDLVWLDHDSRQVCYREPIQK